MTIQTNGDELEKRSEHKEFLTWWRAPEQQELRSSCAEAWGWKIWQASRNSLKVIIPEPRCRYADDSYKAYSRSQVEALLKELGVTIIEEEI